MSSSQQALQLKDEGNAFFKCKNYEAAIRKFSEAISLDPKNHTFYGNRAASFYFAGRFHEVITDCQTALRIEPRYAKAWLRKADAHDALLQYAESIESYQKALQYSASSEYPELHQRIQIVTSKIMNPASMNLPVLLTIARAHSIPIPQQDSIYTPPQVEALRKALMRHPKWGSQPKVRYLVVPEEDGMGVGGVEIERGVVGGRGEAEVRKVIGGGCREVVEELLWSEDWVEYANGRPHGVGLGRVYTTYECVSDPSAARHGRGLNKRASRLLGRDIHGTVLLKKTNHIKIIPERVLISSSSTADPARPSDELGWEMLTVDELRSEEFRTKLRGWPAVWEWHQRDVGTRMRPRA